MASFEAQFGSLSDFVRGIVVASILVPSAITGILGGSLSDRISRKRTIALGSAIFAAGSAISCGSNSLGLLIFGRCVAGTGEVCILGRWSGEREAEFTFVLQGLFLSCLSVYV